MDEADRTHLKSMLQIKRERLHLLEEQKARLGPTKVDPHVQTEIETLRTEIAEIKEQLAANPGSDTNLIDMPFVIVAMTHEEASSLTTRELFQGRKTTEEDKDLFEAMHNALQEHGIKTLDSYGPDRESWQPYQQRTIREIVEEFEARIGSDRKRGQLAPIVPRFYSADFFASEPSVRTETWTALKHSGCVIIIDGVSLFHPLIRDMLVRSQLLSSQNNRVAILFLSPINAQTVPVNQLIVQQIEEKLDFLSYDFDKSLNKMYEIAFGDDRTLRRWIFTTLPQLVEIAGRPGPHRDNVAIVREQRPAAAGIDKVIYGP